MAERIEPEKTPSTPQTWTFAIIGGLTLLFSGGCSAFFVVWITVWSAAYREQISMKSIGINDLEWSLADLGVATMIVLPYGAPFILIGAFMLWFDLRERRKSRKDEDATDDRYA